MSERLDLSEVLAEWIARQRLEKADLARLSGIGRNTLYRILDGMPAQADTLRKLARGLATDPLKGEVDPVVRRDALRDFADATGLELVDGDAPPNLETALRAEVVTSPRQAARLAAFLRKYPNMSADQRRLVDALVDHLGDAG